MLKRSFDEDVEEVKKARIRQDSGYCSEWGSPPYISEASDDFEGYSFLGLLGNVDETIPDIPIDNLLGEDSMTDSCFDLLKEENGSIASSTGDTNYFEAPAGLIFGQYPKDIPIDNLLGEDSMSDSCFDLLKEENGSIASSTGDTNYLEAPAGLIFGQYPKDNIDVSWVLPESQNIFAGVTNYRKAHDISNYDQYQECNIPEIFSGDNPYLNESKEVPTLHDTPAGDTNFDFIAAGATKDLNDQSDDDDVAHEPAPLHHFFKGSHFSEKFRIENKITGKFRVMSLDEVIGLDYGKLITNNLITKVPMSESNKEKLKDMDISKKRSVVACENVIRGFSLSQKWDEIKAVNKLDNKKRNNIFSNFQRSDRKQGAGEKLYQDFMTQYGLTRLSSYQEIEEKCAKSFAIFGNDGCIDYISSLVINAESVFFLNNGKQTFLIKNFKGFCRVN